MPTEPFRSRVHKWLYGRNPERAALLRRLTVIANLILGLIFIAVPLNSLLHVWESPPMGAESSTFVKAMQDTGYLWTLLKVVEICAGLLALAGWGPLAVLILAPVVLNIFAFHLFLERSGLPLAVLILALELYQAWRFRKVYAPLFRKHRS
jgi:putative oxidoreductase